MNLYKLPKLRGYNHHFIKKEINRARIIQRQETSETALKPQPQNNNSNRTPFVIIYNPALPKVSTAVWKKYKHSSIIHSLQTNISVSTHLCLEKESQPS